jgi:ATP-dependent Lhr-like helicase
VTPYRLVALSATIGDLKAAARWLRPDTPDRVEIISDLGEQKTVLYRIHGYLREKPVVKDQQVGEVGPAEPSPVAVDDLFKAFNGTKGLVFANPKAAVESYADALNDRCRLEGLPEQFLVHHGSLSREIREETERLMQGVRPFTTLCSSTLELGIDIGDVQTVGHLSSPWSVSSLVQRLGRSGRKDDEPHSMRVYVEEDQPDAKANLCDRLYPDLLRAIALTELMLEKWVESPDLNDCDLSTLVQQVLSVLAETGGIRADRLFERLVTRGAFRYVERETFVAVLRSMAEHDLIEQMPEGDLILGIAGQRIVAHYDFYSAFATPPEYRLVHGGRPLGRLPASTLPREKDHILFAGRRWTVVAIDHGREEILVEPARGRKTPLFEPSRASIHPRVREKMRAMVTGTEPVAYLDTKAAIMLEQARSTAREAQLLNNSLIAISSSSCLWFTWTGSKTQQTLATLADIGGLKCVDHDIALEFSSSCSGVRSMFEKLRQSPPLPIDVAQHWAVKRRRKYDAYLTDELLDLALSRSAVALDASMDLIELVSIENRDEA